MDVAADVLFCFVNLFHKTSCDGPETNHFVAILISSFYEILSVYAAVTNIFLHLSLSRAADVCGRNTTTREPNPS